MNRQPGTMEPPRLRDAGSSPRLDKLAASGHRGGCRLLRMPGAAARLAVASPPCRYMITRPAVLDACWSRPVARWLYSGHRRGLMSSTRPAGWLCSLDPRRGLISWQHQGTAAMDAGASQEPAAAMDAGASQEPAAAIN